MPSLILLLLPPSSKCADDNNEYNKLNVRTMMSMIMATMKDDHYNDERTIMRQGERSTRLQRLDQG